MRTTLMLLGLTLFGVAARANLIKYNSEPIAMSGNASTAQELVLVNGLLDCSGGVLCEFMGKIPTGESEDDPLGFIAGGRLSINPSLDGEPLATTVSWDLSGTGWELCAILVKADGHYDVYIGDPNVANSSSFGSGEVTGITIRDRLYTPSHFSFIGHHVPDGGATVLMLGMSFLGLAWFQRKSSHPVGRNCHTPGV